MQYTIDYKKLFDGIVNNRNAIAGMVTNSYDEVTSRADISIVENMQGVKLLSEYRQKLGLALEELGTDNDLPVVREAVLLLINYLRIAYILLGNQR